MDSKELYLNISQIISTEQTGMEWPTDFERKAIVHVSRSSNGSEISHVTVEFAGVRAKFFCCILFDGSGDYGTSVHNFAMPRLKLTLPQKALAALSVLQFLVNEKYITASFEFFREKICADLNGGVGNTLSTYDKICKASEEHVKRKEQGKSLPAMVAV